MAKDTAYFYLFKYSLCSESILVTLSILLLTRMKSHLLISVCLASRCPVFYAKCISVLSFLGCYQSGSFTLCLLGYTCLMPSYLQRITVSKIPAGWGERERTLHLTLLAITSRMILHEMGNKYYFTNCGVA